MGMVSIDTSSVSGNFNYYICLFGWLGFGYYLCIHKVIGFLCVQAGRVH